jgi:hypothetical protein
MSQMHAKKIGARTACPRVFSIASQSRPRPVSGTGQGLNFNKPQRNESETEQVALPDLILPIGEEAEIQETQ